MGEYIRVAQFVQFFMKTYDFTHCLMHYAAHDELIDIYIFQKNEAPARICGQIITW